jgi:hypothetical protein
MNETDRLIDAALDSYPLAPLPPRFVRRTMAAIRAGSPAFPRPKFRLEFLDVALPVFFGFFGVTILGLGLWFVNAINPLWLLQLEIRTQWYLQNLNLLPVGWFAGAAIAGVCAVALAVVGLAVALERPARTAREAG